MELARRLEEERHWAPIWREILEEEQNAGTFDSWDLEDEQINCKCLCACMTKAFTHGGSNKALSRPPPSILDTLVEQGY